VSDVARKVIERYLSSLEAYDLDAALGCFTEDVFYSHPPYPHEPGGARHEVTSRTGLAALFGERGKRSSHHRVDLVLAEGLECLAAGAVEVDGKTAGTFVAQFTITDGGQIARYAAYASFPPVGATLAAHQG
jgi:ketosteroid isomerase-like protein